MDGANAAQAADSLGAHAAPLRILVISDAWFPQVNGVVRTLSIVVEHLRNAGDKLGVSGKTGILYAAMHRLREIETRFE